jgi:hypothetical protein
MVFTMAMIVSMLFERRIKSWGRGMKKFLVGFFSVILLAMIAMTFLASMERSVFQAGRGLWPDP